MMFWIGKGILGIIERKESLLKDNVGSNNESCECGGASTKGIWRILAYKNIQKSLKELLKKAVFSQAG